MTKQLRQERKTQLARAIAQGRSSDLERRMAAIEEELHERTDNASGKTGQEPFAGTARRVLRTKSS